VGAHRLLHRAEWAEPCVFLRVAKLREEVRVSISFAADGADGAVDVAGGIVQAAAAGDEGADFAAFGVVERARAGRGRRVWGFWGGG
jgi:hypothetical protein